MADDEFALRRDMSAAAQVQSLLENEHVAGAFDALRCHICTPAEPDHSGPIGGHGDRENSGVQVMHWARPPPEPGRSAIQSLVTQTRMRVPL